MHSTRLRYRRTDPYSHALHATLLLHPHVLDCVSLRGLVRSGSASSLFDILSRSFNFRSFMLVRSSMLVLNALFHRPTRASAAERRVSIRSRDHLRRLSDFVPLRFEQAEQATGVRLNGEWRVRVVLSSSCFNKQRPLRLPRTTPKPGSAASSRLPLPLARLSRPLFG